MKSLECQTCLMYILIKFMAIKMFGGKDNKVIHVCVHVCVFAHAEISFCPFKAYLVLNVQHE